ncbi:MAG TPA: glycoside hydrolase family 30 protein, partial [Opitutaceae bacterium]|nr:glycoside hydrolase family 30 protein [Opitutaceae bacterium]
DLEIDPATAYQEIRGFGGSFNEKGWTALRTLPDGGAKVLAALFDPKGIARFNVGRVPVGASDYAESRYSLAETPDDFALKDFSIERDRERLIPYIKAAKRLNPKLQLWGSAWSPPAWMKTNGQTDSGAMRAEPAIYDAYARYLLKFAQAYRAEGLDLFALCPQNEPGMLTDYPSCDWTGEQLRDFIRDHMGPLFAKEGGPSIWLGTINVNELPRYIDPVMADAEAARHVSAFGMQWGGLWSLPELTRRWPGKMSVQTEMECGNNYWQPGYRRDAAPNDWSYGAFVWSKLRDFFAGGVSIQQAWNMVLDTKGRSIGSRTPWPQNALVTVDFTSRKATYTPAFWAFAHFSHFVQPGAHRIAHKGEWADAMAFRNPDGTVVVVFSNQQEKQRELTVALGAARRVVVLPPKSFATLVFGRVRN